MQAVKKEAVLVGYGVKMRMADGCLRLTVPCNKRWRGSMFFTLWAGLVLVSSTQILFSVRWLHLQELIQTGELSGSTLWFYVGGITLWFAMAVLVICAVLWHLFGQYVLEIGDKTVRVGRSLFQYDFLGTHNAAGLRRIRFAPTLQAANNRNRSVGIKWRPTGGKVFRVGRYNLHLDYGSKQPQVLHMAIEEEQVRTIKRIIHSQCPHLYHSHLEAKTTADFSDPAKEILQIKNQLQ